MIDAGLLIENAENGRRYDRFRDRIMFPIRDSRGRVIAFGGRVLGDDKPKYLNSPETPVFHKGQELYGLYEARKHNRDLDEIMVVEGYMDVIALAQLGLRNAVATLGTATSEEHLKRLFRIVPSVLFCFDGDAAGRNAAWRALESTLSSLQDGRRARFLFLPDGEDPDTLVRAEGTDAFRARINQHAQPLADYFFQQLCEEADPRSLEGKAHLVTLAAPLIDKIPGNNLRALMRQRLSEITGLSGEALSQVASAPRSHTPSTTSQVPSSDYPDYGDIPDSAYYDNLPDVGGYEQPAPPQQHYERSNEGGKGSWKKDGGGKWNKKGKGDFAPRAPRTAVSVESPHLIALRTLLHHPHLAQKVEDVSHFADEDDTYAQLLVALVGALQKTPNLRSLQLIARWHGTEQGRLLRALAEKEWLIQGDNLEQQFFDTITTLANSQSQRRREKALRSIIHKSPSELTDEEKTLLREHYSLTSSSSSKSPTGA
jgi:DNA primase